MEGASETIQLLRRKIAGIPVPVRVLPSKVWVKKH